MKSSLSLLLALAITNANVQTKTISLAWQVTHVDQASPSISPDGNRIVYAVLISGKEQLFTMNLDGSKPIQITHDDINHNNPIWSPDSRKIVFSSENNGDEAVYIMDATGGGEERVTPDNHQKYIHPDWSPDGTKIIYCSTDDVHPPLKNTSNIYTIDLKTRNVTTLLLGAPTPTRLTPPMVKRSSSAKSSEPR